MKLFSEGFSLNHALSMQKGPLNFMVETRERTAPSGVKPAFLENLKYYVMLLIIMILYMYIIITI